MMYSPLGAYIVMWDYLLMAGYFILGLGVVALLAPILFDVFFLPGVKPEPDRPSKIAKTLDGISQLLNAWLFHGDVNYSISGDAYRYNRKRTMAVANFLFRDPDHCRKAFEADFRRAAALMKEVEK